MPLTCNLLSRKCFVAFMLKLDLAISKSLSKLVLNYIFYKKEVLWSSDRTKKTQVRLLRASLKVWPCWSVPHQAAMHLHTTYFSRKRVCLDFVPNLSSLNTQNTLNCINPQNSWSWLEALCISCCQSIAKEYLSLLSITANNDPATMRLIWRDPVQAWIFSGFLSLLPISSVDDSYDELKKP